MVVLILCYGVVVDFAGIGVGACFIDVGGVEFAIVNAAASLSSSF